MTIPSQRIFAGRLDSAYTQAREAAARNDAIHKIWDRRAELWKSDPAHARVILNRLGWIPVLDAMRAAVAGLQQFAAEVHRAGLRHTVLLGMGGSSLAPEVFSLVFPSAGDGQFIVLDSTDPAAVLAVERAVDLRETLFLVASKSGKTIETLSQFSYFHERLRALRGPAAGEHFTAITDAGSQLELLATERSFRRTFLNPADIGGRYSALSYFGLVPAALRGIGIAAVLDGAMAMREACGPGAKAESNPALALGVLLGAAARAGADKMILLASPALISLGYWIEQLVAESTGKEGKGVVPVAAERLGAVDLYARDCVVISLSLAGDKPGALPARIEELKKRDVPLVEIELTGRSDLGAEFFRWEVATAIAGALLEINPFDEPNVQESKDITARLLEEFEKTGEMPRGSPVSTEAGIELYAGSSLRERVLPGSSLVHTLSAFFSLRRPGDYLALLAFVAREVRHQTELDALRFFLRDALRLPVLVGYGPRYLHSIGQLYKGGPASGLFLEITAAPDEDAAVPGSKFTFGQLEMAQALGDLEAIEGHGKHVLRVHLQRGAVAGLPALRRTVESALR